MTPRTTIKLDQGQFIADIDSSIPKGAGFHAIQSPTGAGKSSYIRHRSSLVRVLAIYPVKALMHQERDNVHRASEAARASGGLGLRCAIRQIEKLTPEDWEQVDEIHFDEAQLSYTGSFRKPVDRFIKLLHQAAKTHPVYLHSATFIPELIPVELASYTVIDKAFQRPLNVIQIESEGDIKASISKLAISIREIHQRHDAPEAINGKVPVLAFLDSTPRGTKVAEMLRSEGISAAFLNKDIIQRARAMMAAGEQPEAGTPERAYINMFADSDHDGAGAVGSSGVDVIIATCSLAEGINLTGNMAVVSTQGEAGEVFQRFGRARDYNPPKDHREPYRGVYSWWLLAGVGEAQVTGFDTEDPALFINGIRLATREDYDHRRANHFTDHDAWAKAEVYREVSVRGARGKQALWTINRLVERGYHIEAAYQYDEFLAPIQKVSVVPRAELREVILNYVDEHGLPREFNQDGKSIAVDWEHPIIKELTERGYKSYQFNPQLSDYREWARDWQVLHDCGVKIGKWDVFKVLGKFGRNTLSNWLRRNNPEQLETINKNVKEYRSTLTGYRLSKEQADELADDFFAGVMDKTKEQVFWSEGMSNQRAVLFRIMVGMAQDGNDEWFFPKDRGWWNVPLTNAEGNRYRVREKVIIDAGIEVSDFCEATNHTRKTIADAKTKIIKQQVIALDIRF